MPTMFDDVEAQCPYFHYSQKKLIVCDGIIEGSTTKIEFNTQGKRNQHRRIFCDSKYKNCEICMMLEAIYNE